MPAKCNPAKRTGRPTSAGPSDPTAVFAEPGSGPHGGQPPLSVLWRTSHRCGETLLHCDRVSGHGNRLSFVTCQGRVHLVCIRDASVGVDCAAELRVEPARV